MIKTEKRKSVGFISLGCPKNRVDTEVIAGILGTAGYAFSSQPEEADFAIINTCSFIEEARRESEKEIERLCRSKKTGQKIIVCGCLPQMKKDALFAKFPKIDALVGSADFHKILSIIDGISQGGKVSQVSAPRFIYNSSFARLVSTAPSYAYIKIADGCSNKCSYCQIPALRGAFRMRTVEDIIAEAKQIAGLGIKEIILVANDVSAYGNADLKTLLGKLEEIKGIEWIRLLYLHPAHLKKSLIEFIKNSSKICRYFDIPIQHTDDKILSRMNRPPFSKFENLLNFIRSEIPEAVVRTTVIAGFPGETRKRFEKLLKDVERIKFDWLGVFAYSDERGTPAFYFKDKINIVTARRRAKEIMRAQKSITLEKNKKFLGRKINVLVDDFFSGHAEFQAPEIDGKVIFEKRQKPGQFLRVKVKGTNGYDLIA